MLERPLILTGFMGSGKSSVGRVLARRLGCPFTDLDAEIVAAAGRSINDIFARDGEQAFRDMESECLELVINRLPAVIATGGGVVIADRNRSRMRTLGIVVNLGVSLPQVMKRLHGATDRPLFAGSDAANSVKLLMDDRKQFYADADIRIDTDGKSVEDVAAEILRFLEELRA
ncbi:MAG: shikimate kinase [Desulfuromonadales bacterium]|nr:shikimate kinase [Desulfuromonadales bacterium]